MTQFTRLCSEELGTTDALVYRKNICFCPEITFYWFVFCSLTHLIALIILASICDNFLLLIFLLLLSLSKLARAEFNESDLGEPRMLALPLQRPRTWSRLVWVEVGRRQCQEAKGRHDWEESAPTKPILDRLEISKGQSHILKASRLTLLMRAVMRLLMMSPLKRKA